MLPYLTVGAYLLLFLTQLWGFPLWGPVSTIDEQLQYYQAGRNFAEYGFTRTALLPELSTGSAPATHPYVYNHQPPGPQLLIGVLFRLFGENFRLIRTIFAGFFLLGMACFFRFARRSHLHGIEGAAIAFMLVAPRSVLHMIDHPAYSLFPLFAFLPIIFADQYRADGRSGWLAAAAVTVFIASNFLIYGPLLMIFAFWTVGAVLRLLPFAARDLMVLGLSALAALVLHLLQTVAVVGPRVFAEELWFTLGNRIVGRPSRSELEGFYDSIGFVLYGGHVFSATRLVSALDSTLSFPARHSVVVAVTAVAALGIFGWRRFPRQEVVALRAAVARTLKLALWVAVPVGVPIVLFPAFASDYGLGGTNEFLLGLFVVGALGAIARLVPLQGRGWSRAVIAFVLGGTIAWVAALQLYAGARVVRQVQRWLNEPMREAPLWSVAGELRGKVVMTNVDPTVVGFFTRELAFGGCHHAAVENGPAQCLIRFIRGWPESVHQRPAAFVWFGAGNAFCGVSSPCLERADLDTRYPVLFASRLLAVYDLTRGKPRRDPG